MRLFVGVIIVAIIAFIVLLAFSSSNDMGKQQHLDNLQEQANRCDELSDDGSLQSPRNKCALGLMPQIIEFCEKYPNSDVANGDCDYFLDTRDKMENLASFLDERFP